MARYHQGKFIPRNPHKYVGDPSNIIYRSSWEFNFLQWADREENVLRYASEELHIPYYFQGDGKWHRYFPDFILHVKDKNGTQQVWMVEIKPQHQTQHPQTKRFRSKQRQLRETMEYAKNQAKWAAADTFCRNKGWRFMILTEKELYGDRSL